MKKTFLSLGGLLLGTALTYGQATILPAKAQSKAVVITGATIHVGNGQVIDNGYVAFDKGKITAIGSGSAPAIAGADVIDAKGKQVYPGFIAPVTTIGLIEVESGANGTVDDAETGSLNPNVRSIVAYNTDSKIIPTVRSNGVLLTQPTPTGGLVSGESSVVQLDAWNWEDAAYKTDMAIHLNWPSSRGGGRRGFAAPGAGPQESPAERAQKALDAITNLFAQAKAYAEIEKPEVTNLRFGAMKGLFDGSKKLFVNADGAKEIVQAINFAKSFKLQLVIVGGKQSYLVTEALKENNVPVIIRETQSLPERDEDDVYLPYKLPNLLQQAGVLYGLTGTGFWRQRNLPFEAGQAVGYGLTKEQAVSMITLNNAKILGIDKTTGTLETGKDANLFISGGDALDMIGLDVQKAFIQGRDINLDNQHKQLYRKFAAKYGIEAKL
ncbi:amidohydrolase family protein [Mucilaginibacter myungsuensis]|uniref:Amidohydrolase family protein n=1 Tax=Mucilaginibacter myungsuensis TaxID=649104 RepID=A0A929L0M2_9SPHI|nr:amidohydrolase family protein [Mucilaginibacter myungsuensis]MBE9664067.1 amidohydrolase family protein [Mucilaginibacter myungsuensis]MDN3601245.1 amidohydrolase family protein [Mucilaginibacter myungsuensis]